MDEIEKFYDQVQAEIGRTWKEGLLPVTGGRFAEAGNENMGDTFGQFGLGSRNEAGEQ